jgi:hypothetical protein
MPAIWKPAELLWIFIEQSRDPNHAQGEGASVGRNGFIDYGLKER